MYEKQMELFQDGGKVDKASGNDIPLGSTAAEVRDDQPAMLSEGEMVIPADVVRYFGVEHFMNLRDQAKMGYKKMEAMGQFGTEEGQTLPDDTIFNAGGPPFTIEDIEVIEDEEEPVEAAAGALITDTVPLVTSAVGTANALFNDTDSSGDGTNVTEDDLTSTGQQTAFTQQGAQDLIGTNSFEYLKSLMPQAVLDTATDTEVAAAENYTNNIDTNVTGTPSAASDANGEGPVGTAGASGGGLSNAAVSQPGTGDIQTMMSYPTDANVQGLKDFGALKDSDAGKAFLSLMGGVVSAGMNPGQYAPVVGLVQRGVSMLEPALFGTNKIGKGFAELRDIPLMQANMATRAARSFEYDFANLTPEQRGNINSMALAMQYADSQGYDIANDPNVNVSITDRGQTVVSYGTGSLAPNIDPVTGDIIGDPVTKTLSGKEKEDAINQITGSRANARTAADPNASPSKTDPGITQGFGGGPLTAEEARGDTPSQGGGPDQGTGTANQTGISSQIDTFSELGRGATTSTGGNVDVSSQVDSFSDIGGNTDVSSQVDSFSEIGGNVDTSSQVDSFSDFGGGDDGGDDGGTGGDGSPGADTDEGNEGGMNKGGFIKKRKYKKKKTRRGLAGR